LDEHSNGGRNPAVTSRLRLGTMVLCNDFRHPAIVAHESATLHHLSGGRFELGLGYFPGPVLTRLDGRLVHEHALVAETSRQRRSQLPRDDRHAQDRARRLEREAARRRD